jgi:uroporphyrinogen decarboxylase
MTHEERVSKAIRRQPVDKIPIFFGFSDENTERLFAEKMSMDLDKFRKLVDGDLKHCFLMDDLQMYLSDAQCMEYALKKGFAEKRDENNIIYDRWGIGWALDSVGQKPVNSPISNKEDILNFNTPEIEKEGQFYQLEENFKRYKEEGYAVIVPQLYSVFEKAWTLMGYENFLIQCYEERAFIEVFLDKITDYRVKAAEKIAEYKITCGHTGDDYGTQRGPVMSLSLWRELFKPRLKRIWDVYKKKNIPVMHHSCGDCRIYLNDMIEIGLDVLNPVQASAMPLYELKRDYGDRLAFFGGIDCQDILTNGTPEDVRKNVHSTVSILGKNDGLILSPINIMSNVPLENLNALIDSINEYR